MPREDKGTRLSLSLSLFHFRSATTIRIEKFQIFLNEMFKSFVYPRLDRQDRVRYIHYF